MKPHHLSTSGLVSTRLFASLFASLLAGCALGIPDAWTPPPPPKPCIPIIVDGEIRGCLDDQFIRRNMP